MQFVIVLLCSLTFCHGAARQCGYPGQPHYSVIKPRKEVYDEGEIVTYTCQNNYYMKDGAHYVKEFERKCQCHGLWDGTLPACNYYDYIMKRSLKFSGHITDIAKMVDDNEETCGKLKFPNDTSSAKLYLKLFTATNYVQAGTFELVLRIKPISASNGITMSVTQNVNGNWVPCGNNISLSQSETVTIPCKYDTSSQSLEVQYYIPKSSQDTEISVCTLKVLATTSTGCGSAPRPAHGIVNENGLNITYRCENGYKLRGNSQSSCQWNGHKKSWVSSPFPVCISEHEKKCGTVPKIANGRLSFLNQACLQDYNVHELFNTAILQCNPGYTIKNPESIAFCNESTNWRWKFNLNDTGLIPQGDECVTHNNSAYLPFTIIGILLTIGNILYCCFRYYRRRFSRTIVTPRLEEMQNCENMALAKDSKSQRGNYLSKYTRVSHAGKTHEPSWGDSSAAYADLALHSSGTPSGIQHYLKNNAVYAKVVKSKSKERQNKNIDFGCKSNVTENLHVSALDTEDGVSCDFPQTETTHNNTLGVTQAIEGLEHNYTELDSSPENEPFYNEIYYTE